MVETSVGLFDKLKDAAAPLVDKAKDKVGDVTGVDSDKLLEAADHVVDAGDNISEATDAIREGRSAH
jgi:hypothetical protein